MSRNRKRTIFIFTHRSLRLRPARTAAVNPERWSTWGREHLVQMAHGRIASVQCSAERDRKLS